MMIRSPRFVAPALLLLGVGACADTGSSYPSLLPRPVEKIGTAEPVRTAPVATADPKLDARITEMRATLAGVDVGWRRASGASAGKSAAARGKPAGSDAWIDAQTALAELDQYRAQTLAVLSDIEDASIARASDAQPAYPALEALRDSAQAQLDAETSEIVERQKGLATS